MIAAIACEESGGIVSRRALLGARDSARHLVSPPVPTPRPLPPSN
jgi:hypothetical protein